MDSLSQIVLGAAVGKLVQGKNMGRKAALWGAIAGTIPDLDIFLIPDADPLGYLLIHRSYSHAFLPLAIAGFVFAWITFTLYKRKHSYRDWYILWFWGLITHPMLDCLTTYGTRILLPFSNKLFSTHSISIVDPLYTIPFLILVIIGLIYKNENKRSHWFNTLAIIISTGYLALAMGFKWASSNAFAQEYKRQGINIESSMTGPTILNSILWYGVGMNKDSIYVGEYSLLQDSKDIEFARYARNLNLLDKHQAEESVKHLKWFSTGYYFLEQNRDTINFYNVKFGRMNYEKTKPAETFLFYYKVFQNEKKEWMVDVKEPGEIEGGIWNAIKKQWNRILGYH